MLMVLRSRTEKISTHTQKVLEKRAGGSDQVEGKETELSRVAQPLKAGHHQGQQAQPKRTPRSKR